MNSVLGGNSRRRGGLRWWVLILFALYAGYYYLSHRQDASFTGRTQLIDSSPADEARLGLQAYQEILSESRVVSQGEVPGQVQDICCGCVTVMCGDGQCLDLLAWQGEGSLGRHSLLGRG